MHLLIDQSRKGSAPPTPRPPLPSVNQSRNNLMIGAPCPFLVPSVVAASFASGIIMTPRASGNFSLLLTPGFSLFRGFQRHGAWATKKAKGVPDMEEKGLCGIDRELAAGRSTHTSIDLAREDLVWRFARLDGPEKNRASFHSNAASTYSRANILRKNS